MPDEFTEGHYVLGIEGLALLRAGATRRRAGVECRTRELAAVAAHLDHEPYSAARMLPAQDPAAGYAGWAESYDQPGNDTIAIEEPVVRGLLDDVPAGPVLDAACGTGRHAAYLLEGGREVVGVDSSPEMLERARARVPRADLREGSLESLPLADASVGAVVCALALSHLPEIGSAVAELSRVLAVGGRLVISDPHPFATAVLGWRAVYVAADGTRTMIPEYPHMPGEYVRAFGEARLTVRRCLEPALSAEQARGRAKAGHEDAFAQALTGVPAVIVWEAEKAQPGLPL
ncbi:MAG: class I SAM-dependent methyltransferase [Thermoleophilaceae bacterium]